MNKISTSPILSICIPTWNRAKYLRSCLVAIKEQIHTINTSELELFVSDNCSEDNTKEVVNQFIQEGLPITYNRNEANLGAAGNFLKCMQYASGKYILLLGDDDILNPDAISFLLELLRGHDYGLVHIRMSCPIENPFVIYDDRDQFLKAISYWLTFISGNIFQRKIVSQIKSPEDYVWTHLLQMPYYIMSALSSSQNVIIYKEILKISLDGNSNGGYNFYEVFVDGYLSIWTEFLNRKEISKDVFESLKRDLYERMVFSYNLTLLIQGRGVKNNREQEGKRGGLLVDNAWKIQFKHYYAKPYFWLSLARLSFQSIKYYVCRILKR